MLRQFSPYTWGRRPGEPTALKVYARVIVKLYVRPNRPDGRRVVTASDDRTARVWDAVSGQPVTPPLAHQREVLAVAWSPDGRRVATASKDGTARVWDVSGDNGSVADWRAILERCDYLLDGQGALVARDLKVPASSRRDRANAIRVYVIP